MSLEVRPVRPDELARVGELTVQAYVSDGHLAADDPYAAQLRRAEDRAEAALVLVAVEDGEVVGAVTYAEHGQEWAELARPGEAEIRMLVADPARRGRGVGRALVEACVERARTHGCTSVVLSSQPSMTTAHGLYGSAGFVREPALDWSPVPGVDLMGFRLEL